MVHARPILSSVLNVPKNSVVQQYPKLVRFHGADLLFTDAAIKEIARIALDRGTGARGLRSVVEEVLEGVLFEVEAGVRYETTGRSIRGWEPPKRNETQEVTAEIRDSPLISTGGRSRHGAPGSRLRVHVRDHGSCAKFTCSRRREHGTQVMPTSRFATSARDSSVENSEDFQFSACINGWRPV